MALPVMDIPPLDPYGYTGPVRVLGGVARSANVTLDSPFGSTGVPEFGRWLYVGVTGNVTYVKWDGTTQTLANLAAGVWHPIYAKQVNTSGTTATNIVWGS